MTKQQSDMFFVCAVIEQIARQTKNHRGDVAQILGEKGISHQLKYADINHCLPLEQVSDELIEEYGIPNGTFDTISKCKYKIPSAYDIGKVYSRLACHLIDTKGETPEFAIYAVFCSFISDAISNFNTAVYYQSPEYLQACYDEGTILD